MMVSGLRIVGNDDESGRTKKDAASMVLDWLKRNAVDGRITASLSVIAEATGLKYSTVSRALHALEARGSLRLLPKASPADPNTIQMVDDVEEAPMEAIKDHMHHALVGLDIAAGYMAKLEARIRELEARCAELSERAKVLEGEIMNKQELPGGVTMVLVRKQQVSNGAGQAREE